MAPDSLSNIAAEDPGEAFEELCWGLLRRKYPAEQLVYLPAALGGDHGIEGFSKDGIAYQCYADRDSLTLRHRTDKQKNKLNRDTLKLKKYATELEQVLDGVVLHAYFLMVPQYHAAELVAHAAKRSKVVREFNLSFIDPNFAIGVKTPQDYPAEYQAALSDGAAKALLPTSDVTDQSVQTFQEDKPQLVNVLDGKLAIVKQRAPGVDVAVLRDQFIRAVLAKEQVMRGLEEWPDTWEAVERRRQLQQDALELESQLSSDDPDRRALNLIRDYKTDLTANVAAIRDEDAQLLAKGQTGEWLMRCPLSFRDPT